MLSEMLGELNGSHTGCRYRPSAPNSDETASLGLLYDLKYTGPGLKVAEVIQGGPADRANIKIGYIHVRAMDDASMRVVVEEALGRNINKDAIIVDTRFNGGGNIHEELSDFLTGQKYFEVIPHGWMAYPGRQVL
jgi:C-terminal processing protease CtpA/Prc